jgi:hypothetical protein
MSGKDRLENCGELEADGAGVCSWVTTALTFPRVIPDSNEKFNI